MTMGWTKCKKMVAASERVLSQEVEAKDILEDEVKFQRSSFNFLQTLQ